MRYSPNPSLRFIWPLLAAAVTLTILWPGPCPAQGSAAAPPAGRPDIFRPPSFGHVVEGGARCDLDVDGTMDFVVGSPYANRGKGAVYVFSGDDYSLLAVFEGQEFGDWFGYSLDCVGDVNLDGRPDLLIGAPLADITTATGEYEDAGKVYLYSLPPTPGIITDGVTPSAPKKPQTPYWGWQGGEQTGQRFGWSVSAGGLMIDDAIGVVDDYYDFIVGSPGWDWSGRPGAGKVSVFKGGPNSYWNDFASIFESGETWHAAGDSAGYTVIGDWDFIGVNFLPDFAFSSPYRDGLFNDDVGSVSLVTYSLITKNYFGGDNQLAGSSAGEHFGWSLTIGNLDFGDLYPDLIVGSPGYDNSRGRITAYHGGPTVIPFIYPHFRKVGDNPGDRFGHAVGYTPMVYDGNEEAFTVGAPQSGLNPGYARLFYYTFTDWGQATYDDAGNGDRFGFSVCRGGLDPEQAPKKRMIIGVPGAGLQGEAWVYVEQDIVRVLTPEGSLDPGIKSLVGAKDNSDRAERFVVAAYPNPFNPKTEIRFTLPRAAQIRLEVFNLKGQRQDTLVAASLPAGEHHATWEPRHRPSGTYFYRLQVGEQVQFGKLILLK